ncbi:hypothetical protein ACFSQT_11505 [Mesorhizobium calcicola]|uniref:Uncharacterized protein n=1 Tax=Mesorhizobium calcicola TaxID=1300310 RepID=A0ABW4WB88_9HYPH
MARAAMRRHVITEDQGDHHEPSVTGDLANVGFYRTPAARGNVEQIRLRMADFAWGANPS